eukprot:m.195521 g.195521  ORF g.195521 m.195521 type:complete len:69 (-) comp18312_c1_seq1:3265-3471(-)
MDELATMLVLVVVVLVHAWVTTASVFMCAWCSIVCGCVTYYVCSPAWTSGADRPDATAITEDAGKKSI